MTRNDNLFRKKSQKSLSPKVLKLLFRGWSVEKSLTFVSIIYRYIFIYIYKYISIFFVTPKTKLGTLGLWDFEDFLDPLCLSVFQRFR